MPFRDDLGTDILSLVLVQVLGIKPQTPQEDVATTSSILGGSHSNNGKYQFGADGEYEKGDGGEARSKLFSLITIRYILTSFRYQASLLLTLLGISF